MRKIKYTVKPTTQFKKDYKLAMKRGLKIGLLEDVVSALAMWANRSRKRTTIMPYPGIGQGIVNVIFSRTGC